MEYSLVENMEAITSKKLLTYEEAIALTKIGKFHYFHLLFCGLCIMSMVIEVSSVSLIMSAAKCDLHFTVIEQGLLGSSGFIGVVFGSQVLGISADTEGRRKTLIVSLFISICSSVISSVSVNTAMLVVFRIITGFFVSGCQSVMFSYLSEFHSDRTRVRFVTLAASFMPLASIYFPGEMIKNLEIIFKISFLQQLLSEFYLLKFMDSHHGEYLYF